MNLEKKGKGLAIRAAWEQSDGDILAFMDADLSSDLHFLLPLIEGVALGKCDIAIGNRLGKTSKVYSRKIMRKIASRIFNIIARYFLKTNIADHQCGFKAINKQSFQKISQHLQEDGWLIDTELIAVSVRESLHVLPIDIIWRDSDRSKVKLFGDSIKMFTDLIRLRRRLNNTI